LYRYGQFGAGLRIGTDYHGITGYYIGSGTPSVISFPNSSAWRFLDFETYLDDSISIRLELGYSGGLYSDWNSRTFATYNAGLIIEPI